jgi:Yip1-like protein
VIARPQWGAMLLVMALVMVGCSVALMQTDTGRVALVDQWERTALAFGQDVGDARYAQFKEMSREHGTAYAALSALVTGPALTLAASVAIFAVFTGIMRGTGTFTQVLAIAAHAGVILALRQVVAAPLNYARETLASPTTLGMFFPMLDEASPAARFLGTIDLFVVWWVVVLAIGVSLLYRRPARSTALIFMGAYVGIAAVLAIVMAVSGGT